MPASDSAARAVQTYVLCGNPCRTGVAMLLSYVKGVKRLFATRLCLPNLFVVVYEQSITDIGNAA
jgi:hypothetical protein